MYDISSTWLESPLKFFFWKEGKYRQHGTAVHGRGNSMPITAVWLKKQKYTRMIQNVCDRKRSAT